ncbi:MAG: NINE protein [Aquisalinus sp.]|nr:NINE protein [Aquisalinus sp.]
MTENEFLRKLFDERDALPTDNDREAFDWAYFQQMKNPVIQYGYNYFLGWLGIDKFTLENAKDGFLKLAAGIMSIIGFIAGVIMLEEGHDAGGFLFLLAVPIIVWVIVDFFLTPGATREYNAKLIDDVQE